MLFKFWKVLKVNSHHKNCRKKSIIRNKFQHAFSRIKQNCRSYKVKSRSYKVLLVKKKG